MPIVIEKLTYTYQSGSVNAFTAIMDVSLTIHDGEFVGLIGHTGSGKSTLIQQLNGLMQPTSGKVLVDGFDMSDKKQRAKGRALVGMVFQYPDYQLFDETVYKDISFGPKNMKLAPDEIDRRVREAMRLVGLDFDEFAEKSPFELSGGEKRRTALAGIIAMYPKYLVLDEPMAGLDPAGRRAVLAMIDDFRKQLGCAVVMVSHSMDDIARSADKVIVLRDGAIFASGTPAEIFSRSDELYEMGLEPPFAARMASELKRHGFRLPGGIYTNEALADALAAYKGGDLNV
ncbi:MAG: energy-coupling factor transporter ATPase [Clostridiales bacterium]|nr:energy-coupling factor transporter ATPase [Clostridiales bacterium]